MKVPTRKIKISKESKKFLQSVFAQYVITDTLPENISKCIIHMYPKEDTTPGTGVSDALSSQIKIYFPIQGTVYNLFTRCDIVTLQVPNHVRVFKDGSTAITISTPCKIILTQNLLIEPILI